MVFRNTLWLFRLEISLWNTKIRSFLVILFNSLRTKSCTKIQKKPIKPHTYGKQIGHTFQNWKTSFKTRYYWRQLKIKKASWENEIRSSLHGRFHPWAETLMTYQGWNFIPWYRRNQLFFIFVLHDNIFSPGLKFSAQFSKAKLKLQPGVENNLRLRMNTFL